MQTPRQMTPSVPINGVVKALDDLWHTEGPLSAADLRVLSKISQTVVDLHNALDSLSRLAVVEVEELENSGAQDPAKATRVVQARQALARFDDLTIERVDPESIDVVRLDDVVDLSESPRP